MLTFEKLRKELEPWVAHNFPKSEPFHPLLGIGEEIGELFDTTARDQIEDAVADVIIYLADYANRNGVKFPYHVGNRSFGELVTSRSKFGDSGHWSRTLVVYCGKLNHAHLKRIQGIRGTDEELLKEQEVACVDLLNALCSYARSSKMDLQAVMETTWKSVSARDWQKFPKNGRTE